MTKVIEPAEPKTRQQKEELGLMDSYGSFPVWMLKIISLLTPSFLISKPSLPPKKENENK